MEKEKIEKLQADKFELYEDTINVGKMNIQ